MLYEPAYAKINWALCIKGTRADGYHLLDMLMQPVSLRDDLYFAEQSHFQLEVEGSSAPAGEDNLVWRAADALSRWANRPMTGKIRLIKRIPSQAGLGGGSADCAAALKGLCKLWNISPTREDLLRIGLALGADVPFCLTGTYCRIQGIGEVISPLPHEPHVPLVILKPTVGVPTAMAFRIADKFLSKKVQMNLDKAIVALSNENWLQFAQEAGNDLTGPAVSLAPEIGSAMEALRESGALYVQMSGSGSAVYGVFADISRAQSVAESIGPNAWAVETI